MKVKRVLVFATQHLLTGGIESHLQEFCKNMFDSGIAIDLVVLNGSMDAATEKLFQDSCKNVYMAKSGRSKQRYLWLLKTGLKLSLNRYNSLYTNGQGSSPFFFSKLILRKKKWVHHHHTAGDSEDQKYWSKSYIRVLQSAQHVIACSKNNAKHMSTFLERDIDSIPCFSKNIVIEEIRKPGKLRFGYYGRLIPEKGINILCDLSIDEDFHDIEFHLWGEGQPYGKEYFERYPKINYHGKFDGKKQLTSVLSSLDAFLLISTHSEGLPICLLECMSAGVPWLATEKGGIIDIAVDPYATRLISSHSSVTEIKAAILSFAEDINKGKVSSESQINLYNNEFSNVALSVRWEKILS
jgi:glycosyltransferase involved in cell wall biosynthesis